MAGDRADEFHRSVCCMSHDLHSHRDGRCVCWTCSELYRRDLSNLAACLREAAGLCHEFERGWWSAKYAADISPNPVQNCLLDWRPGCGRVAPGFEGK